MEHDQHHSIFSTWVGYQLYGLTLAQNTLFLTGWNGNNIDSYDAITGNYIASSAQSHTSQITSLAVSGQYMYSGSQDNKTKKWDLGSVYSQSASTIFQPNVSSCGSNEQFYYGHSDVVNALVIGDDGLLYSGSQDTTVIQWNPLNGALLNTYYANGWLVNDLLYRNGTIFSAAQDGLHQHNTTTADWLNSLYLPYSGVPRVMIFWQNNIIVGTHFRSIIMISSTTGATVRYFLGHYGWVEGLATTGDVLFSVSRDWSVRMWDIWTGCQLKRWNSNGFYLTKMVWYKNFAYFGGLPLDNQIGYVNTSSLTVGYMAVSTYGSRAVIRVGNYLLASTEWLSVVNLTTKAEVYAINKVDFHNTILSLAHYQGYVYLGSNMGYIKRYDLKSVLGNEIYNTAPDTSVFNRGSLSCQVLPVTYGVGHSDQIYSLVLIEDKFVLTGNRLYGELYLWDQKTMALNRSYSGFWDTIYDLAYSDGAFFVAQRGGLVRRVNYTTGATIRDFNMEVTRFP